MKIRRLELALPLAYGGALWMQLLYTATGAAHTGPLLFVISWLGAGSVALSLILLAVAGGSRMGPHDPFRGVMIALPATVAVAAAVLLAVPPFGAHASGHDHGTSPSLVALFLANVILAFPVMLVLGAGLAFVRRGSPEKPAAPIRDAAFTRRELLKVGIVGGAALFLPFRTVSRAWADSFASSPPATPFRQPLPVPPRAVTSTPSVPTACLPGKVAGVDFDFYEVRARVGEAQIYPAAEGSPTPIWGYTQTADAITPGPTFLAEGGRPIVVRFVNDLAGEQEPNGEPVQLTVHLHGGHQQPRDDGWATDIAEVPDAIFGPGATRDYCYPNSDDIGARSPEHGEPLWYHDHLMDATDFNVWMGLAGTYLVHDSREDVLDLPGTGADEMPGHGYGLVDIPLLIQDRSFGRDFSLVFPHDDHGTLGDQFLVNGAIQPFLDVGRRKYRFRLYNGSSARWYNLALSSGQPFVQVGTDGGLLPAPVNRPSIRIGPSERHDVIVDFTSAPGTVDLLTLPLDVPQVGIDRTTPLVRFNVAPTRTQDRSRIPDALATFAPLPPPSATRSFRFDRTGGEWTINGRPFDPNEPIATARLDTVEHWTLENGSGGWVHPIHIHDVRTHILARNGQPPPPWERGERDVTPLAPNETALVALKFVDFVGPYVMHCHNLAHEDMRMMARFDVVR
jgi:FtsP/CotA-like multicopper oxidase with cupredoxin domain